MRIKDTNAAHYKEEEEKLLLDGAQVWVERSPSQADCSGGMTSSPLPEAHSIDFLVQ